MTASARGPGRWDLVASTVTEARAEVARTDGKAGTLLALATGALTGLVTLARAGHLAPAAAALLWLAAALTGAALALLLTVVRPRLGSSGTMFADHAALLTAADLYAWQEARLRLLSALAVAKHRRLRRAVDLLLAGLVALATAAVLIAVTGPAVTS